MNNTGVLFALLAALLWGIAYTIDQRILSNVSAIGLFLFDAVLAAIVLLPLSIRQRGDATAVLSAGPATIFWAVLALLVSLAASYCILAGIKESNATLASIIEIAYPCFVVLFSALAFRQFPNGLVLVGGFVALAGVATVIIGAAR